jgi:glycosyltransferase involved in cell wall biosynthesis
MKIAVVGPFFLPQMYGVEKVMWYHARYLAHRGHDVHVITSKRRFPFGQFDGVPEQEVYEGFTIHRIPVLLRSPSRVFYYLSNSGLILGGLYGLLEELRPDVVHVHNVAAPAWAHTSARYTQARGKRLFYSLHYHPDCLHLPKWRTSLVHGLNKLPLNEAQRIFHLTAADFDPFEKEYPKTSRHRFEVLPNGVLPPEKTHPNIKEQESGELKILFVGRVEDHRKGFDLLESVFARIRRPEWTLTVVGRISDEKRSSLQNRFGNAVRALGVIDELALEEQYAAADIFVMPSRYEGFGMPYIEAMRYGVPVVGTRVGGIPETVPPGTGILVDTEDQNGLSDAIVQLGTSAKTRKCIGDAGKVWSSRFHWDRIIDQLEAHYLC